MLKNFFIVITTEFLIKIPKYVLIPTAGIWYDGYEKWHPTYDSIIRTQYGKKLSEQFSVPLILAGIP